MKIGIQTISWGTRISNLDELARQVAALGYQGLEFAQNVRTLPPPNELRQITDDNGLAIVGFAGGPLASRADFVQVLAKPAYLFVDEWDEKEVLEAIHRGFTVAIHPHRYKSIGSMSVAKELLEKHPQLKLIVDTAHFYLAGDDVLKTLKQFNERVIAVHLKDWTSQFGRSPLRFARGFTELGEGELGKLLDDVVKHLQTINYQGWAIVEQDTHNGDPFDSAKISRVWLNKRRL